MANRRFLPPLGSLEVDVVELFGQAVIGAAGAVTSFSGKGIANVARTATGRYVVTFSDRYNALLFASIIPHDADISGSAKGGFARLYAVNVNSATPSITFQMLKTVDSAEDPFPASVLYFTAKLRNSSVA